MNPAVEILEDRRMLSVTYPKGIFGYSVVPVKSQASHAAPAPVQKAPTPTGSISGLVYNDVNGNGVPDFNDLPLFGGQVFIDSNNNGLLDGSEKSVDVDTLGGYVLGGLTPGHYIVREVPPTGYVQTSASFRITLGKGQAVRTRNFTNVLGASVSGKVFADFNNNHLLDPGEIGLQGWHVFDDVNNNGRQDPGEVGVDTNAAGSFSLVAPIGPANIRIVAKSGFFGSTHGGNVMTASLHAGDQLSLLFGEVPIR